ncbi:MAG: hypothetical protein ABL882_10470 [Sphingopyxis sp.]
MTEQIKNGADGPKAQVRRPRKDAFSPQKQGRFFARLAETANITTSAEYAGVSVSTVKLWRRKDAAFRARWAQALSDGYADIEMRCQAIALFGAVSETSSEACADGVRKVRRRRDQPDMMVRLLQLHKTEAAHAAAHQDEAIRRADRPSVVRLWGLVDAMRARAITMQESGGGTQESGDGSAA